LTDVRKNGKLWWLRPDGKTQVTIEYLQKADGSVEPQKIHTVVISTQHAEPLKATRTKECAGYSGPEMTAPSMEDMNKLIVEEVIKETLKEITLKNGKPALTLFGDHTHLHINPSGKFIIGGPQGDAGLTGRRSSLTPMVVGAHMVVARFQVKIQPRSTVLQHTSADRWRNR
jgi:S-adenosylmethionine synthetase